MTKRLITKDSAKHENEHLWSSPKPAGNIMKTNLFVILGLLISLSAFSQNLINDAQDSIGLKLVFGGRYTMVVKPGLMRDVAVDDFWELENHARKKIIGVWGTNDNENARFAFFEDSVYYPDTNLWYEYDLIGDTLLITKENNYKVKVLINKISSDSMTLNYLDYGVIKTFKKR